MSYADIQIKGERERARHLLDNLRRFLNTASSHLEEGIPTSGVRQGVVQTAVDLSERLAVIDCLIYSKEHETKGRGDE